MITRRRALVFAAVALAAWASPARERGAWPLTVVAAADLRVEPRLAPDRSALTLAIRLRDDHGAPIRDGAVQLRVQRGAAPVESTDVAMGPAGEASHVVPLTRDLHVVTVVASYAGNGVTAPQQSRIEVDLDAPYVTVDLVLPPEGVDLGASRASVVTNLRVGEMASTDLSPGGFDVQVREGDRVLGHEHTDASGRAVVRVDTAGLGRAGVHAIRAVTMVHDQRVEGPPHDLLVYTRTVLSLVRDGSAEGAESASTATLRGVLLTVKGAPVADAAVRVARGTVTLAGARTDRAGAFTVRLGPEVLAEHGVSARAVYDPPEPWFLASESPPVAVTAAAPPTVHWSWEAIPAALAALAITAVAARSRLRGDARPEAPSRPDPSSPGDRVEHVGAVAGPGLRVRFVVVDRATQRPVEAPSARWGADAEWRPVTGESVAVQPARRVEFEVGASGYAPRKVTGEFARPGEYVVRVQLRTWREELFERARPWLRRAAGRDEALPTPREALAKRAATPDAVAFVELVEEGCYAPREPGAREVARAEALSPVLDASPEFPGAPR